jgi:predicted metal-dependent hydrolase
MGEQFVHYENIGNIAFIKNKRAKNLRITVNRTKGIKVTIPGNVSMSRAFRFVEEKKDWIQKNIVKLNVNSPKIIFKPGCDFSTRFHSMDFEVDPKNPLKIKVGNGIVLVKYPNEETLLSEAAQNLIVKGIEFAVRKEAKHYLPLRVEILAKKFGLNYADVKVKNMKTRWGSCSVQNNINLNIHLMRLPEHLTDYVIIHELVHTVHKNHGKQFWQTLDKLTGNARLLAKEMKEFSTQIF